MRINYIALKGMPLGGGIEKYTEEVGSRLAKRGHKVIVYTMKHYGATNGYYKGMEIRTVPTLKIRSLEKMTASCISTILQCAALRKVDIVHFHAFGPGMFSFMPRFLGRKVVVQGHGIEWRRSRWGTFDRTFLKLTEIPSVKFPHAITVVSKVQKKYLEKKYGIESIYIPTGVNQPNIRAPHIIKERYGLKGNDFILFAARLVREKGAHYLIDAFNKLRTNLKLVIAGDAQHEAAYKGKLLEATKGNRNIVFTGFVTGPLLEELFSNCYLFVLPSELEGLPIALLEAMSYGNCCIASDIDENIEVLEDYGFRFKNKDAISLRETLDLLISEPSRVEEKRVGIAQYVLNNFSWDTIASKFEELYASILS